MSYWFRTAISAGLLGWLLVASWAVAQDGQSAAGPSADATASTDSVAADVDTDRDATASLAERLQGMHSFAADFVQEVRGAQGEVLERSSGLIRILRPNFKWEVNSPYPQVIVADGEYLRVYDPDLEQVTLRPVAEALEETPISLLTQDDVDLAQHFAVAEHGAGELGSYVLTPRGAESMYAEIRIAFDGDRLIWLAIVDHLGQLTEIEFTPAAESTVIQSDEFSLTLPPGTDVIGG